MVRRRLGSVPSTPSASGNRLFIDPADRRALRLSLRNGTLDRGAVQLWRELVDTYRPEIALDIGANYGEVALGCQYAHSVTLHLIEPNPRVAALLERSVAAADLGTAHALVHQVAAANRDRTVKLFLGVDSGTSSLVESDSMSVPVRAVPLDTVVARGSAERVLFKLDVEGAELEALQGMAELVSRDSIGICEIIHADVETLRYIFAHFTVWLVLGPSYMEVDENTLVDALSDLRAQGHWPYGKDVVLTAPGTALPPGSGFGV